MESNEEKKPFSDKRWTMPLGGKVTGHREHTKEEKIRSHRTLLGFMRDSGVITDEEIEIRMKRYEEELNSVDSSKQ